MLRIDTAGTQTQCTFLTVDAIVDLDEIEGLQETLASLEPGSIRADKLIVEHSFSSGSNLRLLLSAVGCVRQLVLNLSGIDELASLVQHLPATTEELELHVRGVPVVQDHLMQLIANLNASRTGLKIEV